MQLSQHRDGCGYRVSFWQGAQRRSRTSSEGPTAESRLHATSPEPLTYTLWMSGAHTELTGRYLHICGFINMYMRHWNCVQSWTSWKKSIPWWVYEDTQARRERRAKPQAAIASYHDLITVVAPGEQRSLIRYRSGREYSARVWRWVCPAIRAGGLHGGLPHAYKGPDKPLRVERLDSEIRGDYDIIVIGGTRWRINILCTLPWIVWLIRRASTAPDSCLFYGAEAYFEAGWN